MASKPLTQEQILAGACRAILRRGFPATRIADVAAEAGVSTAAVHYHFETKDDVLLAALKWATEHLLARVDELRRAELPAAEELVRLLELGVPHPGPLRDEYVLWIELWTHVLHRPDLLERCEEISVRWREFFFAIVREGVDRGEFAPVVDPTEVAERIIAMVDGLGFETVVGYSWTSPERMHERTLAFAAEQLGLERGALGR